jgi:hypothetical protein
MQHVNLDHDRMIMGVLTPSPSPMIIPPCPDIAHWCTFGREGAEPRSA